MVAFNRLSGFDQDPSRGPRQVTDEVRRSLIRVWAAGQQAAGEPWADGTIAAFRDHRGVEYVALGDGDRFEYFAIGSPRFRAMAIAGRLATRHGSADATWWDDAETFRRVAQKWPIVPLCHRRRRRDGAILFDLGERYDVSVRIDSDGWAVTGSELPWASRSLARAAVPRPQRGASLWDLIGLLFGDPDDGVRLVIAALLTAAVDPRVQTPWPLILSDDPGPRSSVRRCCKQLLDPAVGSIERPCDLDLLDGSLQRQLISSFADLHDWRRPLVDRLVGNPFIDYPAGNLTERPWVVLDGVDAPAYPRTLVDRCVPISVSPGAAVTRELHAEFLGATFDVLSRRMVRREAFDPAWLPGPLAGFAAHGQAVAKVLGFDSSCFDEALCEQLAIRDRLAADSAQPPW